MRNVFVLQLAFCSILTAQLSSAQQSPANVGPRYDLGNFANDTYTNECLGFSFLVPKGWLAKSQGISGVAKAIHLPGGGLNLLMIEHPKQGAFGNTITLYASPASEAVGSAKDFVTRAVGTQVTRNPQNNQILRETFAVDYAGKHFFRADYKAAQPRASVRSFVFTQFRNYYLGEMLEAASPAELDSAADSLKNISFREDVPDPKCSTGEEAKAGVVMGVISEHPVVPTSPDAKIRVSEAVSGGLLLKKVQPDYPEAARKSHVEGPVVLTAVISARGDVEDVRVTQGDPILADAALTAVRQWKYKPYQLEGHPLRMETRITVEFQLPTTETH